MSAVKSEVCACMRTCVRVEMGLLHFTYQLTSIANLRLKDGGSMSLQNISIHTQCVAEARRS
jgi:hypothetical protein